MNFKFVLAAILFALFALHASALPPAEEINAIRDFYDAIPELAQYVAWFTPGRPVALICSDWPGIQCANDSIVSLSIPYTDMSGSIPNSIGNLKNLTRLAIDGNLLNGTLPASLATLPLEIFRIERNQFTSPFPSGILNISTLREVSLESTQFLDPWPSVWSDSIEILEISGVKFTGQLPAAIGSLPRLRRLWLDSNLAAFNGTIPSFLFQISSLEELRLKSNEITEPLPDFCGLSSVRRIELDFNQFSNYSLQNLGCLSNLTFFSCRACGLTGGFPSGLNTTSIRSLIIDGNSLSGSIPRQDAMLPWKDLNIGYNNFTGSIPLEIWNSSTIETLTVAGNFFLTGTMPFQVLPINLVKLDIQDTDMFGDIPIDIGNWRSVTELYFGKCPRLYGTIPASIGNLTNLRSIQLAYSPGFSAPLPSSFGSLPNLYTVNFVNSSVAATPNALDIIFNITSLQEIYLSNSGIPGTIPESIGKMTLLRQLILFGNELEGTLPASVRNLQSLEVLDIRQNRLNGTIPSSMSYILTPTVVYLSQNQFSGCFDQPTVISDPNKCLIDDGICGCTKASCNQPVCVSPGNAVCSGPAPVSNAVCRNGIWVISSTVTISGGQVIVISTPTLIGGNLIIVGANSTLSISPTGSLPDVSVAGCVSLNGTLEIKLNSSLLANSNMTSVAIVSHSGYCGGSRTEFTNFNVISDCGRVNGAVLQYSSLSVSLLFDSFDSSTCKSNGNNAKDYTAIIIGCSVAGGVVLIAAIVLIIAFKVPAVGDKLMPWRSRRNQVRPTEDL